MSFEVKPDGLVDFSRGTPRDRMLISFRNGQKAVFKLHAKSPRLICDHSATSTGLLEVLGREIQTQFRPPSRMYNLRKPAVTDVLLDMEIQLQSKPYVIVGKPLIIVGVIGEKTFGLTPAYGSPVTAFETYID